MNNILTYIKFRGDLSMKEYPFNEVDALILSELSYIRFENVVPGVEEKGDISISDAAKKYMKSKVKELIFYKNAENLLDAVASSPRYANLRLSNYISTTNTKERQQFSAIHVGLNPFETFIAFRGTDETIVGWREDCDMSYMMPVPAQISAVDYVNKTAKRHFCKYILGGHSKGGNLAIYSGVFCQQNIQKRIKAVYSFDGPGFNKKMVNEDSYQCVKDRIHAFVPESSVIGMLMEHEEVYQVVKSENVAFLQHDGFNWCIERDRFDSVDSTDDFSNSVSYIVKSWLEQTNPAERKVMVDVLFDIFEAGGIETVMDFKEINIHTATAMIKEVANLPKDQREIVGKLIKLLIEESKNVSNTYDND